MLVCIQRCIYWWYISYLPYIAVQSAVQFNWLWGVLNGSVCSQHTVQLSSTVDHYPAPQQSVPLKYGTYPLLTRSPQLSKYYSKYYIVLFMLRSIHAANDVLHFSRNSRACTVAVQSACTRDVLLNLERARSLFCCSTNREIAE